ncbi:HK97 family phage prohead protease [Aureimonas ureilytica]|uniref:HK97 family phage prohead protease n=1 Tax=Aureimonas ureilytica TaxID=401562 RepID=UPI00037E707A|nr:HK97 family phage prohead protease [Aureimonas ureilytica]
MRSVPAVGRAPGAREPPAGFVSGYASLFDRTDLSGDRIRPGAFARALRERGAAGVRMLWQHDPSRPIGVWTRLVEDERGLLAEGRLALDTAQGREAFALLRAQALDGLSIGFRTRASRPLRGAARRLLLDIDLLEISIVTFPMQEAARVREARGDLLSRFASAARRIAEATCSNSPKEIPCRR